jgi:hypothetical protein
MVADSPTPHRHPFAEDLYPSSLIYGAGMFLFLFVNELGSGSIATTMFSGATAALGTAGGLLGVRQLKGDHRWRNLALAYWALQIVSFSLPIGTYNFFSGLQLLIGVSPSTVELIGHPQIGAAFEVLRTPKYEPTYIGVNLFALSAVIVLLKYPHGKAR